MGQVRVKFLLNWNGEPPGQARYEEEFKTELDSSEVPVEGDRITRNGNTYEVLRRRWDFSDEDPGHDVIIRADTWDVIHGRQLESAHRRELRRTRV